MPKSDETAILQYNITKYDDKNVMLLKPSMFTTLHLNFGLKCFLVTKSYCLSFEQGGEQHSRCGVCCDSTIQRL